MHILCNSKIFAGKSLYLQKVKKVAVDEDYSSEVYT